MTAPTAAAGSTLPSADVVDLFTAALRGEVCHVVEVDGPHRRSAPLPVARWSALSAADAAMLDECAGPVLDVGCGPGRMSAALAGRGQPVLGVDLVPEAVRQTRSRGACALRRDVFGPLPAEGRWQTALLADGNIGIGGDPAALLRRLRRALAPDGRVVCDLAEPGTGQRVVRAHLECRGRRSRSFAWALVDADALSTLAAATGFVVRRTARTHGRWIGVLAR
jgi:SAM-dependent methyltransferase